jgi:ABC-type branched-subunit amino acid transport system ATPase component
VNALTTRPQTESPFGHSGPENGSGTDSLLAVANLSRSFGGVHAVNDVSFEVPSGVTYGLIGPNGAGKSTVMNLIAGSQVADRGAIRFRGERIDRLPDYRRARKGVVRAFQHPAMFGQMTVLESMLLASPTMPGQTYRSIFSIRRRVWRDYEQQAIEEALALLDRFELRRTANEYTANLSGGQQKLLELIRAICAEPVLLLLDEPFAGVHVRNVEAVCELLTEVRDRGVTILMTEHELNLVERLCSVAIVMARGRVIYRGKLAEGLEDEEVIQAYVAG